MKDSTKILMIVFLVFISNTRLFSQNTIPNRETDFAEIFDLHNILNKLNFLYHKGMVEQTTINITHHPNFYGEFQIIAQTDENSKIVFVTLDRNYGGYTPENVFKYYEKQFIGKYAENEPQSVIRYVIFVCPTAKK